MHEKRGFTLIELLVVVSIIALLMAILMPAISRARNQAQDAACLSNLHHWGAVFHMYAGDNEGKFCGGEEDTIGGQVVENTEHDWVWRLLPYYKNRDLNLCPSAKKPWTKVDYDADGDCTFLAWGVFSTEGMEAVGTTGGEFIEGYEGAYGSYGKNSWCGQWTHGLDPTDGTYNFRNINVRSPAGIPLFVDCLLMGAFPTPSAEPPPWPGAFFFFLEGETGRYCLNRHLGHIKGLFVDLSTRKIGLKEIWELRWHRNWAEDREAAGRPIWPDWMRKFPEYARD